MSTPALPQEKINEAILEADKAWRLEGKAKPFSQHLAIALLTRLASTVAPGPAGTYLGALLINRETQQGVSFYSPDMIPEATKLKGRFELVHAYEGAAPTVPEGFWREVRLLASTHRSWMGSSRPEDDEPDEQAHWDLCGRVIATAQANGGEG